MERYYLSADMYQPPMRRQDREAEGMYSFTLADLVSGDYIRVRLHDRPGMVSSLSIDIRGEDGPRQFYAHDNLHRFIARHHIHQALVQAGMRLKAPDGPHTFFEMPVGVVDVVRFLYEQILSTEPDEAIDRGESAMVH